MAHHEAKSHQQTQNSEDNAQHPCTRAKKSMKSGSVPGEIPTIEASSCFESRLPQQSLDKVLSPFWGPNNGFTNMYPSQLNTIMQPFGRGMGHGRGTGVWNNRFEPYYTVAPLLSETAMKDVHGFPMHSSSARSNNSTVMMDETLPIPAPMATLNMDSMKSSSNNDGSLLTKKAKPNASNKKLYIDQIHNLDVLCGRGGRSNHHLGNKVYRQVVNEMKMNYRCISGKKGKTNLSEAIVNHVCNYGGRFLKKDETEGKYYLLSLAEARKKTSQALREKEAKWTV